MLWMHSRHRAGSIESARFRDCNFQAIELPDNQRIAIHTSPPLNKTVTCALKAMAKANVQAPERQKEQRSV